MPNPDTKVTTYGMRDGTLVAAFNNATRRGHQSNLMLATSFDPEGKDWSAVASIEESAKTIYSSPSIAQIGGGSEAAKAHRSGPLLVAFSVAETVFGHFRSGVPQYNGIKVASVDLGVPRMHVRRGKQGVSFRNARLSLDLSPEEAEDKRDRGGRSGSRELSAPCLHFYHPSLFALFKGSLTDVADLRAQIGMQLKVAPKTRQVKGKAMYSGLGGNDGAEVYFNAKSNITHRLVALKACDARYCTEKTFEKESTNLVVVSGIFASNADSDEYESPVLAGFKIVMADGGGKTKTITVDVDADKKGDWYQVEEELRFLIKRQRKVDAEEMVGGGAGDDASGRRGGAHYAYKLELFFGEDRITDFEWTGKLPSYVTFGCSRSLQGACTPRGAGLCRRNLSTKFLWHVQDIALNTNKNQCNSK